MKDKDFITTRNNIKLFFKLLKKKEPPPPSLPELLHDYAKFITTLRFYFFMNLIKLTILEEVYY